MTSTKQLQDIANVLRRDILKATTAAGSGHATSSMSCAEIISVLFFKEMHYDRKNAFNPGNDEFILSKGHAVPALYAALYRAKAIIYNPNSLRKLKSDLEGHPVPSRGTPSIKVATGSLGQGLSVGAGFALAAKKQKRKFNTYVLMGDSEAAEGSIYEAAELAVYYKLNNLIAILDINRLGQRGETIHGWNIKAYKKQFEGFGWNTITINGHNIKQIISAFANARKSKKPTIILAKTVKGKGVSFLENKEGWHGKAIPKKDLAKALNEIPNPKIVGMEIPKPRKEKIKFKKPKKPAMTKYEIGEEIATRDAYGNALTNLAKADSSVIAIDAEVSNSTKAEAVKKVRPKQFVEAFIAEQNMAGMALGLSKQGFNVFGSSFACFLSRAHDQFRMIAYSKPSTLTFCGSHAGISIGEDGPSQMGLEDIAMFRSLPYCFVFYPSDAVSTEKLTHAAYKTKGLKYIRTTRPKTPVLYKSSESFPIGDFKVLRKSEKDKAVLAGSGITTHEALKANNILKRENNVNTAVVDLYSIVPFKADKFAKFVKKHGNKVIISEDHYPEGGIGEMLTSLLNNRGIKLISLSVKSIPHSGKKQELLDRFGISAKHIVKSVLEE